MQKRQLTKSGIMSSVIGFGGASIAGEGAGYGFGSISEADSISLVHEAIDRGINLFDTAPIYGFGTSEERFGKALKGKLRDDSIIISKSGIDWHSTKRVNLTNDPKVTHKMLHESLRRLDTDYIDVYMIHWPDDKFDIRESIEILSRAKEAGKIRAIGLCNTNIEDYKKASEIDSIDVLQGELNFLKNESFNSIKPILKDNNIKTMSWGTLEKGVLTGRVTKEREYEANDCRKKAPWFKRSEVNLYIDRFARIKNDLEKNEITGLELAINYNLSHSEVAVALTGFRNSAQLNGVCKAAKKDIDRSIINDLVKKYEEAIL